MVPATFAVTEDAMDYSRDCPPKNAYSATISGFATVHQGDVYNITSKDPVELLHWLPNLRFADTFRRHCDKQIKGTGTWLLRHPTYLQWLIWLSSKPRVLWCHGDPGIGKTVLCSMVIRDLQTKSSAKSPVLYIYFDYAKQKEHTPAAIMGDLLRRLIRHNFNALKPLLEGMHKMAESGERQPTMDEMRMMFHEMCKYFAVVTIVIDALDEANQKCLEDVVDALDRKANPNLALLMMGRARPSPREFMELDDHILLEIRLQISEVDLRTYLTQHLSKAAALDAVLQAIDGERHDAMCHPSQTCADSSPVRCLKQFLQERLVAKTRFSFLAAELCVNEIRDIMCEADLNRIIEGELLDYQNLYDQTFARIRNQSPAERLLAFRAMSWVALSKRPLQNAELCHAIAMNYTGPGFSRSYIMPAKVIRRACLGLLTAMPTKKYLGGDFLLSEQVQYEDAPDADVRLIHSTVLEYLETNHLLEIDDRSIMAASWQYLAAPDLEPDLRTTLATLNRTNAPKFDTHPFARYALFHWHQHVSEADEEWPNLLDHILRSQAWLLWAYIRCAQWDGWNLVEKHLDRTGDKSWRDNHTTACLMLAMCFNWRGLLAQLLATRPINYRTFYIYIPSIVSILIRLGRFECLQLFLNASSLFIRQVLNQGKKEKPVSVIHEMDTVAIHPSFSSSLLRALLDKSMTWLGQIHSVEQFQEFYGLLNACGIKIDSTNDQNETLLHMVAWNAGRRHSAYTSGGDMASSEHVGMLVALMDFLFAAGADPNKQTKDGRTPFQYALFHACPNAIALLFLERGADVRIRDASGNTALYTAVKCQQMIDTVGSILSHGSDVNARNEQGNTALHSALWTTHSMVELLLSNGALSLPNDAGITPLHIIMHWNHSASILPRMRLTPQHVNAQDCNGDTPMLHLVKRFRSLSDYECKEKFNFLLQYEGFDPNLKDSHGDTALHIIAKKYLAFGADPVKQANDHRKDLVALIRMLVSHKADVNEKDSNGDTIAHLATRYALPKDLVEAIGSPNTDLEATNTAGVSVAEQIRRWPYIAQVWVTAFLLRKHWYDEKLQRWHISRQNGNAFARNQSRLALRPLGHAHLLSQRWAARNLIQYPAKTALENIVVDDEGID